LVFKNFIFKIHFSLYGYFVNKNKLTKRDIMSQKT
jgi:hypothetical protein